jgi:pimeloyl-ACP methyl ester carboxylesterase
VKAQTTNDELLRAPNEDAMTVISNAGLHATQFKTVDGLKIRFAVNEKQDGNPILLLSPLPESIFAFLPTWETFSALGPLVAIDLPPFGLSESRSDARTPETAGEFVLRILESFRLDRPHVIAPDIGTPACLFAAANHPGVFRSLVIGSGATDHTDILGILDAIVNAPSLEPFRDLTGERFVREAVAGMKRYKLPEYVLQDYIASYAGQKFWDAMEFIRDYPRSLPRLAKRLPEITVPCQLIVGRHDPFVPVSNAEGLHRGLPKSRLNVLDCGHFVWEEAWEEYGRLACEFIQGGYAAL